MDWELWALVSALFPSPTYKEECQQVDSGLRPQGKPFGGHVGEGGAHGVDTYISVDAEGGREEPRNRLPEWRYAGSRP